MTEAPVPQSRDFFRDVLETAVRLGVIGVLLFWCFNIVRPFIAPVVWGIVMAVAVAPLNHDLLPGWATGPRWPRGSSRSWRWGSCWLP